MIPRFYFACCQFGAEKAVKAEVLEKHPSLRFAFSRPGFITFKEDGDSPPLISERPGIFVRHWGVSVAQAKDRETLKSMLAALPAGAIVHGFERDTFVPGDDPPGFVANSRIDAAWTEFAGSSAEAARRLKYNTPPRAGETVHDLIWLDDFHVFLGKHTHRTEIDPAPGNQPKIELPAQAPSRAYLKLAEAIHRFRVPVKADLRALEIGCSPGGATTLMLKAGMQVLGIDPKEMSPEIYDYTHFHSIRKPAKAVSADELRDFNPDWIVMDMNLAPLEALDELTHVVRVLRKNHGQRLAVRTGFITLKLNDWKFAQQIPLYLKRLREIGFQNLTALQLASNRQEFFVYARNFK